MSKNTGGARRGRAAGDTDIEKQASQLASDVKYKVRKSLSGQTNLNPAQVAKSFILHNWQNLQHLLLLKL